MSPVTLFWVLGIGINLLLIALGAFWPGALWTLVITLPLFLLGVSDCLQRRHAVLRNFPVIGHFRYLFEMIRPEIQQYFVESEISGRPFNRELRSVVYQRAKGVNDTRPFGTVRDLYEEGVEWVPHSISPHKAPHEAPRIPIGEGRCEQPYQASILNISAMSFGSLSANAVRALNGGARLGGFAHNTGEGGISPYHLEKGGDLIWQIGTGYFGARTPEGSFSREHYAENARRPSVKMIEVKLSQGAKPGHGGILPAEKVTPEIAGIRGVPMGKDVLSPPWHTAFDSPRGLLEFVTELRELSGGKPVGFKLCLGRLSEFLGICKAMLETGLRPDFITVDGAEGGTGAAPMEFSNTIGVPLTEGLLAVHNALIGCGVRRDVKVIGSGKIVTGFNIIQRIAIAADLVSSARAMMFALGCIQALRCNSNHCPVGVATQDPLLSRGLHVGDKEQRVHRYHHNTVEAALEMMSAAGVDHPDHLTPHHVYRRTNTTDIQSYADIYDYLEEGALVEGGLETKIGRYNRIFAESWKRASPDHF